MNEIVLFVDDEENVLRSLNRLFYDKDYNIITAKSGKEGLEILKTNEVAVIISDQRMPEMSGADFLEHAKSISPNSVRIVLTGYADITAAIDAINKGGAYRYISKPWNDDDLILTIQNAMAMYKLVKENRRLTELTKKQNKELKKWSSELELYVQQQTIDLTRQNQELTTLNKKLTSNLNSFINACSNLIDFRDKNVCSHSNNVTMISVGIAKKIGLTEPEIATITIAAQLHDIGKIGVSDIVLSKDIEEFTPDEFDEYKKHPVRGQAAIDFIEDLRNAGILIRHHHESLNGRGFPDQLTGNEIPLGSRIITIADSFDRFAISSDEAYGIEKTLDIIKSLLNSQFDPYLYIPLVEVAKETMAKIIPFTDTIEMELSPKELRSQMIISRDVRSGTGLLLLVKGVVLSERCVKTIRRYNLVDPSKTGVFVRVKRR